MATETQEAAGCEDLGGESRRIAPFPLRMMDDTGHINDRSEIGVEAREDGFGLGWTGVSSSAWSSDEILGGGRQREGCLWT